MRYTIYHDRIKLIDSHLVPKRKMGRELTSIRNLHPTCGLWQRSDASIKSEWRAHNFAYAIGIARERTKDCDLNFALPWYAKAFYWLVGAVAWVFIK